MIELAEPAAGPVWRGWTPLEPVGVTIEGRVFDRWSITSPGYREAAWAGVSTFLDTIRQQRGARGVSDGATVLLEALEPSRGEVGVEVFYWVKGGEEGVELHLCRSLEEGARVQLVVRLMREAGGKSEPVRIRLVGWPGFEESERVVAELRLEESSWRGRLGRAGEQGLAEGLAGLSADVLTASLWRPLVGSEYADARLRGEAGESAGCGVQGEVVDRMIDEVYSDTVFPPRLDGFELNR